MYSIARPLNSSAVQVNTVSHPQRRHLTTHRLTFGLNGKNWDMFTAKRKDDRVIALQLQLSLW